MLPHCVAVVFVAGCGLWVNAWRVVVSFHRYRCARFSSVLLRAGLVGVVLIMPARLVVAWRVAVLLQAGNVGAGVMVCGGYVGAGWLCTGVI